MQDQATTGKHQKRLIKRLISVMIACVLVTAAWVGYADMQEDLRTQSESSIRSAILNAAKQCFSIEGSYPSSLKYLEDNYGLVVNHNNFFITYNSFAENIMPDVMVKKR